MSAITQNITIEQGVDFGVNITVVDSTGTPVNLSGATAIAQIRAIGSHALLESFAVNIDGSIIHLTLAGPASLAAPSGAAKWDVLLTIASRSYRLVQGDCFISQAQSIPS